MTSKAIAAAYVCDANYHDLTLCSIGSLARAHEEPLAIYFFQKGYERDAPEALRRFVEGRGHSLTIKPPPAGLDPRMTQRSRAARGYTSATTLLKPLIIDRLTETHPYVAYVDSDVLVFQDLKLGEASRFSALCAACLDFPMTSGDEDAGFEENCRAHGLSRDYVNAGFYIINSERWKRSDFLARYQHNVLEHNETCSYLTTCVLQDQCPFNMTVAGDLHLLPITYNVQRWALYTDDWRTAKARHYTGGRKFLDPLIYKTDPIEHALMGELERTAGAPARRRRAYDGGLTYELNRLRRRGQLAAREQALAALKARAPR